MAATTYNVNRRLALKGGWLHLKEDLNRMLERELKSLNDEGYRVRWILQDEVNLFWYLGQLLRAILTLGFSYRRRGLMLIAEPIPQPE